MTVCTPHNKAVVELAKALGCPPNTKSMTIHVEHNHAVTVTFVTYADPANICSLTETIKKFELKEKK